MELNPLLRRAVELGASDIHLKVGLPPILRRDGALSPLDHTFKDLPRTVSSVVCNDGVDGLEPLARLRRVDIGSRAVGTTHPPASITVPANRDTDPK